MGLKSLCKAPKVLEICLFSTSLTSAPHCTVHLRLTASPGRTPAFVTDATAHRAGTPDFEVIGPPKACPLLWTLDSFATPELNATNATQSLNDSFQFLYTHSTPFRQTV